MRFEELTNDIFDGLAIGTSEPYLGSRWKQRRAERGKREQIAGQKRAAEIAAANLERLKAEQAAEALEREKNQAAAEAALKLAQTKAATEAAAKAQEQAAAAQAQAQALQQSVPAPVYEQPQYAPAPMYAPPPMMAPAPSVLPSEAPPEEPAEGPEVMGVDIQKNAPWLLGAAAIFLFFTRPGKKLLRKFK